MRDFWEFITESEYYINVSTNKTNYQYISKSKARLNRLKHLIYQIEQNGSPLMGEKVSEILLGAVNLNTLDLSYPFVDVKVVNPIKGVTENGELISIKTSRDSHTLEEAVTYVNGFRIDQLIQFGMNKLNLNLYKSGDFKSRNAMKLSNVISYYQYFIKKLFGDDEGIYTYVFSYSIIILNFFKEYLSTIKLEKNPKILKAIMVILTATFVDKKFNTNYIDSIGGRNSGKLFNINISGPSSEEHIKLEKIKQEVLNYISNSSHNFNSDYINYGDSLPNEISNLKISYCILFFDEETDDGKIILNLYKTQNLLFKDLFNNSMKIWLKKKYHISALNKYKKKEKKQNLYLNYDNVVLAFQGNKLSGGKVFDTHIKIQIEPNWTYKERAEGTKKMYVKIINKIKGIENDKKEKEILNLLNKHLNRINISDDKKRNLYINKFKQFLNYK